MTFIHRRTEHGWAPEAELAGTVRENYAYTVIDGDRVACWGTSISQGVRIYRRGDDGWLREPAYLPGNEWLLAGGVGDMDGEWMVMSRYAEWQWPDGLALVYRFDGRAWRFHSALVAPGLEGYHGGTLALEDDLIAVHACRSAEPWGCGEVATFRLVDETWRHEATITGETFLYAIDGGRILASTSAFGGAALHVQREPGRWEVEASWPGRFAHLEGNLMAIMERLDGPHPYEFQYRVAVYERTGGQWLLSRTLYPSTARGGHDPASVIFTDHSQPLLSDGAVFVRSVDDRWREYIVGFPACRADFNGDGVADFADLLAFLEAREVMWMAVDYDNDGVIGEPGAWDEGDFLEFMRALEEGC